MTRESDKAVLDIIKTEIAVGRIRGAIRAVGDMAHVEAIDKVESIIAEVRFATVAAHENNGVLSAESTHRLISALFGSSAVCDTLVAASNG